MGFYRHLTREDREEIAVLRAAGHSMRAVAAAIGRAASTISRELKRNALDTGRYSAQVADGAYMARRQRPALLERDRRLAGFVRDRLTEGWSPGKSPDGCSQARRRGCSRWPWRRSTSTGPGKRQSSSGVSLPAATSAGRSQRPGRPAMRSGAGLRSTRGPRPSIVQSRGQVVWVMMEALWLCDPLL